MLPAGSGAAAATVAEAGSGAVGDGRVPMVSKPVSRRSLCTGAGVGARVGDISPEEAETHPVTRGPFSFNAFHHTSL